MSIQGFGWQSLVWTNKPFNMVFGTFDDGVAFLEGVGLESLEEYFFLCSCKNVHPECMCLCWVWMCVRELFRPARFCAPDMIGSGFASFFAHNLIKLMSSIKTRHVRVSWLDS